jgi:hypothetical protein
VEAGQSNPLAHGGRFGRMAVLLGEQEDTAHAADGSRKREGARPGGQKEGELVDLAEINSRRGVNDPPSRHGPARGRIRRGWPERGTP